MTDYKAHELNIYSNNNVGRLKFQDGKGTGLGPGFGTTQEYIFAKYTDDAKGIMQWPVCIPELHTIDNSTGSVMGVAWYIMDTRSKVDDEKKAREDADSKLTTDLTTEAKTRADADSKLTTDLGTESTTRANADDFLQAQIGGLWGGVQAIETDSKNRDSALGVRIDAEITRATSAETALQSNVDAEATRALAAEGKLSDRIDFIVSNTNPTAIDSLSEIVAQFSQNGVGYADRLTYLEGVVAALVNKSQ
jgi:hypothetical protein